MPPDLSTLCLPQYAPLNNEKGQNPCEVARILANSCLKGSDGPQWYPLYPLAVDKDEDHYDPPSSSQASPCLCSMVTYNLIQACAACQHPEGSSSTLWSYFVANCSAKPPGWPFSVPYSTVIPAWALVDSSAGATDIRMAIRQLTGGSASSRSSASSSFSSSSSSATSAAVATPAPASDTPAPIDGNYNKPPYHRGMPTSTTIALALVAFFATAFLAALGLYLRKKRRSHLQGQRLGSTSDLTDEMSQKKAGAISSSYLPTESFLSRQSRFTRDSTTSFATNSVSTRSRNFQHSLAPTSTLYSTTSGSSSFTLERDSFDDDDSISPFSDIHHPPGARVATRDNLHSRDDSISTFSRSSVAESRQTVDNLSLVSSTRSPPSSTGATYGRGRDEEDLISLSSAQSRRI